MTIVFAATRESSMVTMARSLRLSLQLTQYELAESVGISKEDVDLLEHSLPIPLDIKNRLLKRLNSVKSARESQLRLPL